MKNLISIMLLLTISFTLSAQSLEESASILYMKANVLYDSERYDEAVRIYNMALKKDDNFYQAYLMRAKSKYKLGAYKGTKKDIMEFIARNGVTKEVIKIMSKTELNLKNYNAAANYSRTSLELDSYDGEQYAIAGMIAIASKRKNDACEFWSQGAQLGNRKSKSLFNKNCGEFRSNNQNVKKNQDKREEIVIEVIDDSGLAERDRIDIAEPEKAHNDNEVRRDLEDTSSENLKIESVDVDAIQEIEIDEELTIIIGNGLGSRKIDNQPNIFLLADKSGRVVIDVCVGAEGEVISAELDKKRSDLIKPGLISLALRKTKNFVFYPSIRDEQCGFFIYKVLKEK